MTDRDQDFGARYLAAHPEMAQAIELLGLDAVIDINENVAKVRPADDIRDLPGFAPQAIHG